MSDLKELRAQYKEVVGKNAFTGWDAAELQKRIDDHMAGGAEAPVEAATPSVPYPSQDDLDAMRDGTYQNRELKSR